MTVFNWGNGEYWLMGSYYLRAFHMRWFNDHMGADVAVEDISDAMSGFLLSGPKAGEILAKVSDTDLTDLTMMRCGTADLGLHRARIARLSLSGEAGLKSRFRSMNTPACASCCWRLAAITASRKSAFGRCCPCVWKRALASGTPSSPKATPRPKPGWTAGSPGTRVTLSASRRRRTHRHRQGAVYAGDRGHQRRRAGV